MKPGEGAKALDSGATAIGNKHLIFNSGGVNARLDRLAVQPSKVKLVTKGSRVS